MAFVSGVTEESRHTSALSAQIVERTAPTVRERYYQWLLTNGPAHDHDAVAGVGIPLSSVNARRNELMRQGRIVPAGIASGGPYGRELTLWRAVPEAA
jgi:hypothetical protein